MKPLPTNPLHFPPIEDASEEGIVAYGDDFRVERLLAAYSQGIFPWPVADLPLLWFSPDPRFVLPLDSAHVSRSILKLLRQERFEIRFDTAFATVIANCATAPRPGQDGTWITPKLSAAYNELHRLGFAHSVEAWRDGKLVGGAYGLALGRVFFGESMFAREDNASKVAFSALLAHLRHWDYALVDCQVATEHLRRFGAVNQPRHSFLRTLRREVSARPTNVGGWHATLKGQALVDVLKNAPSG